MENIHEFTGTTASIAGTDGEEGGFVAGHRIFDLDSEHTTNPTRVDTDEDGFWDGPDMWVQSPTLGKILRAGEDRNGDGSFDPAGNDDIQGTRDDEHNPIYQLSHSKRDFMALDTNDNGIPDNFDDLVDQLAEMANYWFGDNPGEVKASILEDAIGQLGDPASSGSASIARSYSDEASGNVNDEGGAGALVETLDADYEMIEYNASLLGITNGAVLFGKAFTKVLTGLVGFEWKGGGSQSNSDDYKDSNTDDLDRVSDYHGTFVNGINTQQDEARIIAESLNLSYKIPVTTIWNATDGIALDFVECVEQYAWNGLKWLNPNQLLNKTVRDLCDEWERILELDDDQQIIHLCHSQGGIVTAPAITRARHWKTLSFKDRFHMVVFGSGYAYLLYKMCPQDSHFVYTETDPVGNVFGTHFFDPLRLTEHQRLQQSKITNQPLGLIPPHSFHPHGPEDEDNTYGWWAFYNGGPICIKTGGSIHGEKQWLKDVPVAWWSSLVSVQRFYNPAGTVPKGWVTATEDYGDSPPESVPFEGFNPRQEAGLGPN